MSLTKRCSVCGRFRHYDEDDSFCVICGHSALESECPCGRGYEYALEEGNQGATLHCPRCGRSLRGRAPDFEP
jgi:rubrerythrin